MSISPYVYPGLDIPLGNLFPTKDINLISDRVCSVVADIHNISVRELKSNRRYWRYVSSRSMVAKVLREHYGFTLSQIGMMLGGRDHTTVHHALKSHDADMHSDHKGYGTRYREVLKFII